MTTAIDAQRSFQEKMHDKIRDSIGDLISNEELKVLVDKAVQELFFTERRIPGSNSWDSNNAEPPLIHEIVEELLMETVQDIVKVYFNEHPQEILKVVNQVVKEGLGSALMSALTSSFQNDLITFKAGIENKLQQQACQ